MEIESFNCSAAAGNYGNSLKSCLEDIRVWVSKTGHWTRERPFPCKNKDSARRQACLRYGKGKYCEII